MKRLSIVSLIALVLTVTAFAESEVALPRHEIEAGGGISLINVNQSGVGSGASLGYRLRPFRLPLSFGLLASVYRWDTSSTGDGGQTIFGEETYTEQPHDLAIIGFALHAQYRVLETSVFFLSLGLGAGEAITIETRRDINPSLPQSDPNAAHGHNREFIMANADLGFRLTDQISLVLRYDFKAMKGLNSNTGQLLLSTRF